MTGPVIGMGIMNTDISIGTGNEYCATFGKEEQQKTAIDHSIIKKISDNSYFVSSAEFGEKDCDPNFKMNCTSRASSRTSTTEPFEDVGDDDDEVDTANNEEDRTDDAIQNETTHRLDSSATNRSERRHTTGTCSLKHARFSTISIREYPRVLGDNVTVMGPPISLSWDYQEETVYELEDYEEACQDTRRTQTELKMPTAHRMKLLKDCGYSQKDIQEAVKKANIARNRRKRTVETLKLQPLQEAIEKVVKAGKNPLRKKDDKTRMMKRQTI